MPAKLVHQLHRAEINAKEISRLTWFNVTIMADCPGLGLQACMIDGTEWMAFLHRAAAERLMSQLFRCIVTCYKIGNTNVN